MLGRAKREKGRSESCFRGLSCCGGLLRTRVVILGPLRNVLGDIDATFYVRTHGPLVHSRHPRNRGAAAQDILTNTAAPLQTCTGAFDVVHVCFVATSVYVRTHARTYFFLFVFVALLRLRTHVRTHVRTYASLVIFAFRPRGGSHNARAEMATWLSASSSESSPTHERA